MPTDLRTCMRPVIITLVHAYTCINKILKKLQPESPCIVHVLVLETLQVHVHMLTITKM